MRTVDLMPLPLTVTPLNVHLRALEEVRLPPLTGSTLRGALGNAMWRLLCRTGADRCEGCAHLADCSFPRLWMGAIDGKDVDAPPPYVLQTPPWNGHPTRLQAGDFFEFSVFLFGEAGRNATLWEYATRLAALTGLAEGRGRLTTEVTMGPIHQPALESGHQPSTVRLHLETPVALKQDRQRLTRFEPVAFTRRLAARINRLVELYGTGPTPLDEGALADLASRVQRIDERIRDMGDQRVGGRQDRAIPIEGLVGYTTFAKVDPLLRSVWRLAACFHAGKGAPMGMGCVRVEDFG